MPYQLVKDNRTGYETSNINAVMDGELDGFINAYLKAEATGNWLKINYFLHESLSSGLIRFVCFCTLFFSATLYFCFQFVTIRMPQKTPFIGKGNEEGGMFSMRNPQANSCPCSSCWLWCAPCSGPPLPQRKKPQPPMSFPMSMVRLLFSIPTTPTARIWTRSTSFGMAGVAQLKKDFEAAGADVLLVSAGDSIMGKPLVSADQARAPSSS